MCLNSSPYETASFNSSRNHSGQRAPLEIKVILEMRGSISSEPALWRKEVPFLELLLIPACVYLLGTHLDGTLKGMH